jgi:putative flippase GtrA
MARRREGTVKLSRQMWRFLVTGGVNTVIGYLIYAFGVVALELSYFWAVILSYVIGVSFSFVTFRAFVFTAGERSFRSYPRFILTYVFLLGVNIAALYGLVDMAGLNKLLAQALVIPVCAALSFVINRFFVFRLR